jgi:cation diffusion facilitator family transporter
MNTFREIRRVLWITMLLNLVATVAKLGVGLWTGSLSLIADGLDSVFDSASNVIGLIGIGQAARPADREHPYGHRKAENIATLVIAMLLFVTAWELANSAVERLRNPTLIRAEVNIWSFAALGLSLIVHIAVVWYELREGRRLRSDVLVADAMHTRADILVSLSVAVGLAAVRLGYPIVDPALALAIALVIVKIGVDIIRENFPALLDTRTIPANELERVALSVPGVISSHKERSRGTDSVSFADLHIRVDPAMSTEQAHALAHEVQRRLREHYPYLEDISVHVEPAGADVRGEPQEEISIRLRRLADGLGLSVHDVWAYELDGHYYVDVHLEAGGSLSLCEAHALASSLEKRAQAEISGLSEITTHLEPHGQLGQASTSAVDEARVTQEVQRLAAEIIPTAAVHRVQVHQDSEGWSASVHYSLPGGISLSEAHRLGTDLEGRLRRRVPRLKRVVVHTEPVEE